jgi:hypothetical protein
VEKGRRSDATVIMQGSPERRRPVDDNLVADTPALIEATPASVASETRTGHMAPVATATTEVEATVSEVVAGAGKGNVVTLRELEPAHPRHFVEYAERRLEITAHGRLNIEAMKSDYTTWAARCARATLDEARLDRTIDLMCSDLGLERDGDTLKGVRLKSARRRA